MWTIFYILLGIQITEIYHANFKILQKAISIPKQHENCRIETISSTEDENCLYPRIDYSSPNQRKETLPKAICLVTAMLGIEENIFDLAEKEGLLPCSQN